MLRRWSLLVGKRFVFTFFTLKKIYDQLKKEEKITKYIISGDISSQM